MSTPAAVSTEPHDFSSLRVIILNCTLKPSPPLSHTEGLIRIARSVMEKHGMEVEALRPMDFDIAYGVYPDMTEHGWEHDEWPSLQDKVMATNILVGCTPI